ncbi:hypothetical protein EEW87_17630 (plasmid) [Janibacter melonis]|uniref:Uncharacterized protein n=1 Tax=Janibacter melonis TaxID=262209 RepID=A0A650GEY5_9MICO|nr:hypothetical protein [Janibacter melonis]QGX08826.1 hypothetical protein EEW87_17630 [Janibacter melonis]
MSQVGPFVDEAHEPPPEHHDDPVDVVDHGPRANDPTSMTPEQLEIFMAGYEAGRATGFEDGYIEGYSACDREIARLQRAAVEATRRGDPFPFLTEHDDERRE